MKTILIILALVAAATLHAQNPAQLFEQANRLYQEGKINEAREEYESILSNGYVSGELYYNLGNAYYKNADFAHAILNYERALRLMPNDDDLRHNLQLANLMITDKIEPTPRLFVWDYWDDVKNAFSLQSITWTTYGAFLLVVVSLGMIVLARTYSLRKVGVMSSAGTLLVFALLLVVFSAKISDAGKNDEAIVLAPITAIKNSPDPKSSDAFVLHAGVKVQINDRVNDWFKIRLADGKVGWMENGAAEVI